MYLCSCLFPSLLLMTIPFFPPQISILSKRCVASRPSSWALRWKDVDWGGGCFLLTVHLLGGHEGAHNTKPPFCPHLQSRGYGRWGMFPKAPYRATVPSVSESNLSCPILSIAHPPQPLTHCSRWDHPHYALKVESHWRPYYHRNGESGDFKTGPQWGNGQKARLEAGKPHRIQSGTDNFKTPIQTYRFL